MLRIVSLSLGLHNNIGDSILLSWAATPSLGMAARGILVALTRIKDFAGPTGEAFVGGGGHSCDSATYQRGLEYNGFAVMAVLSGEGAGFGL